ncbi:MAG: cupin domain-containing protein [Actinomycetota bacterium]
MSVFRAMADVSPQQLTHGVIARAVHGDLITLAYVELDPESVLPEHVHENEQVGMMISGSMSLRIGDEERVVRAGESWCIPSNVPHEVHTGSEGAVVVETFSPTRADWERFELQEPREPIWPNA